MISIYGLDKAEVLVLLYNGARQMPFSTTPVEQRVLTIADARLILQEKQRFGSLRGRMLRVDLSDEKFDPTAYERINGKGQAVRMLKPLKVDTGNRKLLLKLKGGLG